MTYSEVQELCRNVDRLKSQLRALYAYIEQERALIEGIGAVNTDRLGVTSSAQNSTEERYTKYLDRLAKHQAKYDALVDEMCAKEDELLIRMQRLSPTEYEVILNMYLMGHSRRKTAKLMQYSEDNIKYLRKQAVKKMSQN